MYPRRTTAALMVAAAWVAVRAPNAQEDGRTVYRVDVDMVMLTFSVTDAKGKAVTGLTAADVRIFEDHIPQKIASFAEGSRPLLEILGRPESDGTSIFILFDTSNQMYKTFPYVCDAIAEFIRRLDPVDSVAIYTFSRNLSRAAPLTRDHILAKAGLTNAVAGDDTALFNCLLLTLRDAAKVPGRKAVVVFSNGPDNTSMVAPGDVGRVAEDAGIPVYVISTQEAAKDPMLTAALHSLTARTGGSLYWARNWQQQSSAFAAVREDIGSSYTACYYPAPNQNQGFRKLTLELLPPGARTWRVRVRAGYQVQKRPSGSTQSVAGNPKN